MIVPRTGKGQNGTTIVLLIRCQWLANVNAFWRQRVHISLENLLIIQRFYCWSKLGRNIFKVFSGIDKIVLAKIIPEAA